MLFGLGAFCLFTAAQKRHRILPCVTLRPNAYDGETLCFGRAFSQAPEGLRNMYIYSYVGHVSAIEKSDLDQGLSSNRTYSR